MLGITIVEIFLEAEFLESAFSIYLFLSAKGVALQISTLTNCASALELFPHSFFTSIFFFTESFVISYSPLESIFFFLSFF